MNQLLKFASEEEGPHISLAAEEIFKIGSLSITNSMIYGLILAIVIIFLFIGVARKITVRPKRGSVSFVELIVEYMIGMLTDVFGSRKYAIKFAPIFAVYFIFIMFSNISGLLPWVGGGLTGGEAASPALRPFTADINGVLAMALFAIIGVQVLSIREQGFKNHIQHYFGDNPLNPINIFVGLLETLGELTRVLSLSLRLFLNTLIGEILVSVFIYISGPATPLTLVPIILFEVLVAYIQAYVFTVLASTYLSMAIAHHMDHEAHEENAHSNSNHPDSSAKAVESA